MITYLRNSLICLLLGLVGLGSRASALEPETVPRSPRDSMASFVLADPTLAIELVAAEPQVTSPVAIAWDEDGRLYVAEMNDYPVASAGGRIRLLEDRDGDGRYEHATVFAEGLPFPTGVMPCFGGVLVTAAPNILFLRDRDGDGRAEERRVVLTGFGEGNTQLRVNGLYWGLDNWIYAANGRSDGDVRAPNGRPGEPVSIRRRDVRFRLTGAPDAGARIVVEAIAGFSQFGLAHDDWGNRFPSWNTIPVRHVVLEQQDLDRNPYLAETSSVASILEPADGGRIFGISPPQARFNREPVVFFNASCGPIIECGDSLPAAYHGNVLVCEPLTNLVHRRVLEPRGTTFVARRVEAGKEFLASADPAFRPVNLATGPDGALAIVDMYRELVEHPQFVPEAARKTVDFRRWHDRGRIWRVRPKSSPVGNVRPRTLSKAGAAELVPLLAHPNGWLRRTAQRLLVEQQDKAAAAPQLIAMLKDNRSSLARLHALWALAGLGALDAAILAPLAGDPHPGLREHALRVAAGIEAREHKRLLPTSILIKLAQDPAIRVRLQAALLLGNRCGGERTALEALADIAARDAFDPWMRLAILSGLAESAVSFIPLCERISSVAGRSALLEQAAEIVGVRRRESELATVLGLVASGFDRPGVEPSDRTGSLDGLALLAGVAAGLERSGPSLSTLISAPPALLRTALERLGPVWPYARGVAEKDVSIARRVMAIDVLARGRPDLALFVIPRLLAISEPPEIQAAAARAVARAGQRSLAARAVGCWSELALATRRELLRALSSSPALAQPLIEAMEVNSIAPSELDALSRETLERLPDAALARRASAILAKVAPAERSAALAGYRPALAVRGDWRRGLNVFARNCQNCHEHQGQGHRVGPDLSGIAGRAPEALLSDILDPNREVAADFVTLAVANRRGQVFTGILTEETATSLRLRRAEGVEDTLLRSEIEEIRSTGRSLMPEGLEQSISLQEMTDLIAFLRQDTGRDAR
jgi:putative membrane-bound dehydrogenase-like protein